MFQALSNALSGLYAQKAAMDVISQNISNVNTAGYSRQRVNMSAVAGNTIPAFFSTGGQQGLGVQVDNIARLRDAFLESRGRLEHSTSGSLDRTATMYQQVEAAFGEPSDTGLQSQLANYWSQWDNVAANPTDSAVRSQLVETASTLTGTFNRLASDLTTMSSANITELQGKITNVNTITSQIASLNQAIQSASAGSQAPNELLDQRDLLVYNLSTLIPIDVHQGTLGAVNIFVGGSPIVRETSSTNLEVDTSGSSVVIRTDTDGDPSTTTEGNPVSITNGDVGGLLQSINTDIPALKTSLDAVANSLITRTNTQHALGVDLAGNPGGQFFDASATGAANIKVLAAVQSNTDLIAAQSATAGGAQDGENARAMAELASSANGPDVTYRTLINNLGVQSNAAQRRSAIQDNITTQVDQARSNNSGVSLDEEMANLVQYQHAYDAAAKMITTVDQMMTTLINTIP